MIRRTHIIAIAAAALVPAFAAQAQAANVTLSDDGVLTYAAAPGEVNNARVSRIPGAFRFADFSAPLSASGNCVQTGASVTCAAAGVRRLQAFTGDRNDAFRVVMTVSPPTLVNSGPGDDVVEGSPAADNLFGGTGRDQLRGGPGNDYVDGGADADRVTGNGGANTLLGGAGADVLDGSDPQSQDRFLAGAGNDLVISRDGRPEPVSCGDGVDRARANPGDSVANDCEQVFLF
jgi:Ca2+-binding RTX toxin-like protein